MTEVKAILLLPGCARPRFAARTSRSVAWWFARTRFAAPRVTQSGAEIVSKGGVRGDAWTPINGPVNNSLAVQAVIDSQLPVHSTVSVTDLWVMRAEQTASGQEPIGNSLLTEWQALQDARYVWADPYTLIPPGSAP